MLSLNPSWLAGSIVLAAFAILYPVVLAVLARLRLGVGWRYFGFGLLVYLVFEIVGRQTVVAYVIKLIAPQLQASYALTIGWLVVLSLSLGLFEEFGRYAAFRWLMRNEEKTWAKGVMYGLGHGGLESILLVGGLELLQLINLMTLVGTNPNALPVAQRPSIVQAFQQINAQPAWYSLLGVWGQLWSLPIQVAFSVIVIQVFRRGSLRWLWIAVLGHALVDFFSFEIFRLFDQNNALVVIFPEISITLFGAGAVWVIWRLRDQSKEVSADIVEVEDVLIQPESVFASATENRRRQPRIIESSASGNLEKQPTRASNTVSKNVRRRQSQSRRKRQR